MSFSCRIDALLLREVMRLRRILFSAPTGHLLSKEGLTCVACGDNFCMRPGRMPHQRINASTLSQSLYRTDRVFVDELGAVFADQEDGEAVDGFDAAFELDAAQQVDADGGVFFSGFV